MTERSFVCEQCGLDVDSEPIGTDHRNHCPSCLWSRHLDGKTPGDRSAHCGGMMKPVVLTFKYEQEKTGELMLVHKCMLCGAVSKNRIAGDDKPESVECLFQKCLELSAEEIKELEGQGVKILTETDEREIITQLYGKPEAEGRLRE